MRLTWLYRIAEQFLSYFIIVVHIRNATSARAESRRQASGVRDTVAGRPRLVTVLVVCTAGHLNRWREREPRGGPLSASERREHRAAYGAGIRRLQSSVVASQ